MFIDTHTHLDDKTFKNDLDDVLKRARENGVYSLIAVSAAPGSIKNVIDLAGKFENIYGAIGLHPHDAKHFSDETEASIRLGARLPQIVAIGEIGLDYHYNHSPREIQLEIFRKQLIMSNELDLPVIIHDREATQDILKTIKEMEPRKGVIHCFTGDVNTAQEYLDLGMYISFTGIVTFPKAESLRKVVEVVPLDRMLLETDSPYLAPVPNRGKRNEPAFLKYTAETIAKIKNVSIETLAKQTTSNAKKIFGI